jgi:hypothetical protein
MQISPSLFVPIGAVLAALVAGFFSFLNLVSSKENKVSEFRLAWIDGLRNEISLYTSALQELVRLANLEDSLKPLKTPVTEKNEIAWHEQFTQAYNRAVENLTRIQLRLNPKHIKEQAESAEACLMVSIKKSRESFNAHEFESAFLACDDIREHAAPLLKSTWDLVKRGEPGYQKIRKSALLTIVAGLVLLAAFAVAVFLRAITAES